jgi:hypothetical protein
MTRGSRTIARLLWAIGSLDKGDGVQISYEDLLTFSGIRHPKTLAMAIKVARIRGNLLVRAGSGFIPGKRGRKPNRYSVVIDKPRPFLPGRASARRRASSSTSSADVAI